MAVFVLVTLVLSSACGVKSVSATGTHTTTTSTNGTTTRTTTVGGTIVFQFNEEFTSTLASNQFYVVTDISNNFQAGTPTLNITKENSSGVMNTTSFALEPDTTNQGLVSPVDGSTTATVYRLTDKSSFDSFMSSDLNTSGEDESFDYSVSFNSSVTGECRAGRSYSNYIRIGSGSNILQFTSFTYSINTTPPLQDCNFSLTDTSIVGTGTINDFLSSL